MTPTEIAAALGRGLQLVALVAAVGGALGGAWSRSATTAVSTAVVDPLDATSRRWRLTAPPLLLGALAVLLVTQVISFRDPFEALTPQVQGLLVRTDWGRVFTAQVALAVVMAVSAVRRRVGLYGLLAVASCASLAFTGHSWGVAEGRLWTVGAEIVHAVAAAAWLGGLAVLVGAHRRAATQGAPDVGIVLATERFSRTALVAVPLLLVTGAIASWIHGGGLSALTQPGWGRALAIKSGLVAAMAALGFYNWRVTLPRLHRGDPDVAFGRGAPAWEALLGIAVLGATALLVALSPPSGG